MMADCSKVFVVLSMLFLHVFDDFHLQGILAQFKQKQWWKENASDKMYRFDYIVCLVMHSISWSFLIMFPIAVYNKFNVDMEFAIWFLLNIVMHSWVDDQKANKMSINLVTDQAAHIVQIACTAANFLI